MPPLPPWIKQLQRPLDKLAIRRQSFDYLDLPETEPGDDAPARHELDVDDTLEDLDRPRRKTLPG
jgi:hypothetical protein